MKQITGRKPKTERGVRKWWPIDTYLAILQASITGENWINTHNRQYKLQQPSVAIISLLYANDGAIQQQKLIEMLRRTRQAITAALDNLGKKRLIIKTPCKYDRRMKMIALTEKGSKVAAQLQPQVNRFIKIISSCFTEQEGKQITNMLNRLEIALHSDLDSAGKKR